MYMPSVNFILQRLGVTKSDLMGEGELEVPARFVKILLRMAAEAGDFDKSQYLQVNPDIEAAFRAGKLNDIRGHYLKSGFFEGRGGSVRVDEYWYLRQYPDVARAKKDRKIDSATKHFFAAGELEARAARKEYVGDVTKWEELFPRR
ncbi:hypothetical protein ACNHKD_07655 [Methylocystis sp. JAN1]|uniref:hypothetical protein n=1 Tax=Methylocystis sp. JAN1 TaxID=3397211 RepID=UPI003FA208EE